MSSPSDLARAAIAALAESLEREGHIATPREMLKLLTGAIDERSGTLTVTLTTPSGNAGPIAGDIIKAIEKKTGKTVEIIEQSDPTLLGGAVVSYGDERIDLSVRRSLEDAEQLLTTQP